MVRVEERARYVSDMGVVWTRFPALVGLGLLAGVAVAWGLDRMFAWGWYWIIIVPLIAALVLVGILHLLIGWAQCRNRWLAGLLGAVVGLTAYLGYYEFGLCEHLPPGAGWGFEFLPRYIVLRMENQVVQDVVKPAGMERKQPDKWGNWFLFVMELMMVVGGTSIGAARRAGYAYCPELRQWMRREKALLLGEDLPRLREALDTDRLEEFVATTTRTPDGRAGFQFTVEYVIPAQGLVLHYPVYASLEPPQGKTAWLGGRELRRLLFWQVKLTPREVLALCPFFPQLGQLLSVQHEELRDLPAPSAAELPSDLARVVPVPEPYRQRVRSKGYALSVNLRGAMPLFCLGIGAALVGGGIWGATQHGIVLGWAGIPLGALALGWGWYVATYCSSAPEKLWSLRRLRREIAQRPDFIVAPRDPEAFFLSLIPREAFTKIQWTMSSDLLLMKIDEGKRQLLMEGDSDRYWIPLSAVSVCEPQCFFHPLDKQRVNELWMVRLVIRVEEGLRELLLRISPTSYAPSTKVSRRQEVEGLCNRIDALRV